MKKTQKILNALQYIDNMDMTSYEWEKLIWELSIILEKKYTQKVPNSLEYIDNMDLTIDELVKLIWELEMIFDRYN